MTSESLTLHERTAADIARHLNHVQTDRTFLKWARRADSYQPLVDQLRPLIAEFDKTECLAESERRAVFAVRETNRAP